MVDRLGFLSSGSTERSSKICCKQQVRRQQLRVKHVSSPPQHQQEQQQQKRGRKKSREGRDEGNKQSRKKKNGEPAKLWGFASTRLTEVDLTAYVEKHEFCFGAVLDEHVTNDEVYRNQSFPLFLSVQRQHALHMVRQEGLGNNLQVLEKTTELSRCEREEIEKQKAHERYMSLQEQENRTS